MAELTPRLNARIGRQIPSAHARSSMSDDAPQPMFGVLVPLAPAHGTAEPQSLMHSLRQKLGALHPRCWPVATQWLALLLLALWPHVAWSLRRLTDGSDEPWGVLALATVLVLLLREGALAAPSPRVLVASGALALLAAVMTWFMPPLLAAALGMVALGVFLAGARPGRPATPVLALLLLALPVIASLQFYLGYPLRVATAHAAAPLLAVFGIEAQPAGAALVFRGTTVLIDAPCAGIGMLWIGSYAAALLSYLQRANATRTLINGVAAAALVFAANVLRNVVLFFPESGLLAWPAWTHEAVGLAALAAALVPLIAFAQRGLATNDARALP